MFWIILIAIMTGFMIAGVIIYKRERRDNAEEWGIAAICLLPVIAIIIIALIACYTDYIQFEKSFEIQRGIFALLQENVIEFDYPYVVADIVNANEELATYQASEMMWGIWNIAPARVLDILPIGVG